jgi:glycosyltransferase involved in cell wall biosynthesis
MADYCLAASEFTRRTLVAAGVAPEKIEVIPYGIDVARFPVRKSRAPSKPLRLLFVGTLCQRKGIKYLLDAIDLLPAGSVELTLVGRRADQMEWLPRNHPAIRVRESVSAAELLDAYAEADVFVFPSLAEGFAHVLLEAMASGLPVIATDRTAAPDLMSQGEAGYIVKAGDAADLASHIEKFVRDPAQVLKMGAAARRRAEEMPWSRFRNGVAEFVSQTCSRS